MSAVGTTHSNLQIGSHLGDQCNLIPERIKIPFDALKPFRMKAKSRRLNASSTVGF